MTITEEDHFNDYKYLLLKERQNKRLGNAQSLQINKDVTIVSY